MTPDERARLVEERDFLLASLADLDAEREAGDIDDADHEALRASYVHRAADVLRRLEGVEPARATRASRPARVVAVIVSVALVAAASGWLVAAQSGQRLPGETITGGIEDSTASLLSQARALNFADPETSIDLYGRVLALDPDNVEALTYRAWMLALVARGAGAEVGALALAAARDDLTRAIGLDPDYPDPRCFLGIVAFRFEGDAATAKVHLDECQRRDPPAEVAELVAALLGEVDAALDAP